MTLDPLAGVELFISYASEDKHDLVRPLADRLRRWGIRVWYDEFSLKPGDSLSRSLDKGLALARYGLVVISPDFIRKPWPEYELRGLTAVEMYRGEKVIIPLWHRVTTQDVMSFSPTLADKVAVVTEGMDAQQIAEAVVAVIRPELAERLSIFRALVNPPPDTPVISVPPHTLAMVPAPRRFTTEGPLLIRAMLVVETLREPSGLAGTLDEFLTSLYQDVHPEIELRLWEVFAVVFARIDRAYQLSQDQRTRVVGLLLAAATGSKNNIMQSSEGLSEEIAATTLTLWRQLQPLSRLDEIICERDDSGALSITAPAEAARETGDEEN